MIPENYGSFEPMKKKKELSDLIEEFRGRNTQSNVYIMPATPDLKFDRPEASYSLLGRQEAGAPTLRNGPIDFKSDNSPYDTESSGMSPGTAKVASAGIESAAKFAQTYFDAKARAEAQDRENARNAMAKSADIQQDIYAKRGAGMQSALSKLITAMRSSLVRR